MDSTIEHSTRIFNEQGHFQSYSYANDYNAMKETVHCMYVRYQLHIAHMYGVYTRLLRHKDIHLVDTQAH